MSVSVPEGRGPSLSFGVVRRWVMGSPGGRMFLGAPHATHLEGAFEHPLNLVDYMHGGVCASVWGVDGAKCRAYGRRGATLGMACVLEA
eukprot:5981143-Amphidinium_carterae.1